MKSLLVASALVLSSLVSVVAEASNPEIAAAVIENEQTAQVVKLVVSPKPSGNTSKVICAADSIRVRIKGVAARDEKITELVVPKDGPLRRARIVPKIGGNSVVQLFTKGRTLSVCSRTSVLDVNGDMIISVALTHDEQEKTSANTATTKEEILANQGNEKSKSETIAKKVEKETLGDDEEKSQLKKEKKKKKAGTPLFGKKSEDGQSQTISEEDTDSQMIRYAAGFLLAALVAGAAWHLRKKKKAAGNLEDTIDILTSKRLSAHQQLIVASVHGHKFLLAVGDKSVSSLGAIPGENSNPIAPAAKEPVVASNTQPGIDDLLKKLTSNVAATNQGAGFEKELRNAVENRNEEIGRPDSLYAKVAKAPKENVSNVEGLINMARMRASANGRGYGRNTSQGEYEA